MYQNFKFSLNDELINEFNEKDLCDYLLRLRNKAQNFLINSKTPPQVYLKGTI